ncbi:MAG: response regulator transcription factor [Lachnospiraceae bacterium]|nr:response regulator transcription factor [Lachnospiraceae bacterium]
MKILLVEDDIEISDMLKNFLSTENFEVTASYNGNDACQKFFMDKYSLVLLDLMVPGLSGMEVLKNIREASTVPVIIISAKDSDSDKTLGLGMGADDYITKPFSVAEVLARIKANIRRSTQYVADTSNSTSEEGTIIKKGGLVINTNDYSVYKNGSKIELTIKEFEILKLLFLNPKKVFTKEQIYSSVWNDAYMGDENAVNVHISRLRNKIEEDKKNPEYIVTVWGIGYKAGDVN